MPSTVKAPEGLPVGQLIGKSGSNIKHLQARSGSRIAVDPASGFVKVTGKPEAIAMSLQLLE